MDKKSLLFAAGLFLCLVSIGQGQGQRGQAVQLPAGNGKDAVQSTCIQCHALNLVSNAGFSRADWEQVIGAMAKLFKEQSTPIVDYLAKNFPEKPKTPAVIIPGTAIVK